ncbi:uncharacterized protein NPIL_550181 [Nephila pilipes]|uniref:DUF7041 domain-containing protein n=1 Tax=Nephila pilipes TaxID=299642 RepID=A0A8X6TC04_NEPPI|nr:uncharacterized protein NPIL_550181 [Nephila pilipes]
MSRRELCFASLRLITPVGRGYIGILFLPHLYILDDLGLARFGGIGPISSIKPVNESKTKYNHAMNHLPPEMTTVVRDVIMQSDYTNPYAELKQQIISRCSESKTFEIRSLLAGEKLGDPKTSELLRVKKRLAENPHIDDSLLF